jgi:hypothetical protein
VARSGLTQLLATDLSTILGRLRAAAPGADILLMLPYNGSILDFPSSNPVWAVYVLEMRAIAAAYHVRVVDGFVAFNLTGRICDLTFLCDPDLPDGHPNGAGYALLAQLFYRAAGYPRPVAS